MLQRVVRDGLHYSFVFSYEGLSNQFHINLQEYVRSLLDMKIPEDYHRGKIRTVVTVQVNPQEKFVTEVHVGIHDMYFPFICADKNWLTLLDLQIENFMKMDTLRILERCIEEYEDAVYRQTHDMWLKNDDPVQKIKTNWKREK